MFRFVTKQICLFRLFRYRFETPKQTKNFCFWFHETNAKQILFRFVSVRTEIYFCLFRGHPTSGRHAPSPPPASAPCRGCRTRTPAPQAAAASPPIGQSNIFYMLLFNICLVRAGRQPILYSLYLPLSPTLSLAQMKTMKTKALSCPYLRVQKYESVIENSLCLLY
jgi:hypothetical protein